MVAFGRRAIAKLAESLHSSDGDLLASSLADLKALLSSQESKMEAIHNDTLVPSLVALLEKPDHTAGAADCIASLSLVCQGRAAVKDAFAVAALEALLPSSSVSAASALLSLSLSRDGCAILLESATLVGSLTDALSRASADLKRPCLAALANLLSQPAAAEQALRAGLVTHLGKLVDVSEEEEVVETALQALCNLSNTRAGKEAVVGAGILPSLGAMAAKGGAAVKQRAAGTLMALAIGEGRQLPDECIRPLVLLADSDDEETARNAVAALRSASEDPPTRRRIVRCAAELGKEPSSLVFDNQPWPHSERFLSQRALVSQ